MTADTAVERMLRSRIIGLEKTLSADALAYVGRIADGADDSIRDAIESRKRKQKKLAIVLDTPGGYIEVAERIVITTRNFYDEVDFYIVDAAMFVRTVLVMLGDFLPMDY